MASGSSGRPNSGSKGFDFATDDILCSYEDYSNNNQDTPNHSDPANPTKDFPKSRVSRSVFPTTNVYSPPEETVNQELVSTVERTMKKYADNLMRFLEGISSRLSQLELYCYNLDKSIGEMRSDLVRDHGDADSRLKSLEKHLQEVHRSVQILRDKQELAEAQKELAKLQLAQKESSPGAHEEKSVGSAPESKKADDVSDSPNTQLALALPSQVAPQPSHPTMQQPPPSQTQLPSYYLPPSQLPNPPTQSQPYLNADSQYRPPQIPAQGPQPQMNQTAPSPQFPQYQQQWPQQVSQPMRAPQQQPSQMAPQQQPSPMPPQNEIRAPSPQPNVYSPYNMAGGQPGNPPAPETMHMPFPGLSQPGVSRAEAMQYGYGGGAGGRPVQPQPQGPPPPVPPHMKAGFPPQGGGGDGYGAPGTHPPISSAAGTYMVYENEGSQPHHQPPQTSHYPQQGGYPHPHPHPHPHPRPPTSSGLMIRSPSPPQFLHNHPYNELIDKLVSMGYRGDHVVSVIQRLEDSGQPVDFNAVLDRLNGFSSASSQRGGW